MYTMYKLNIPVNSKLSWSGSTEFL